jgi:hypothetical protein
VHVGEDLIGKLGAQAGADDGLNASPRGIGRGEGFAAGGRDRDEAAPAVVSGAGPDEAARLENGEVTGDGGAICGEPGRNAAEGHLCLAVEQRELRRPEPVRPKRIVIDT